MKLQKPHQPLTLRRRPASDDPQDPQNWSPAKKNVQLLVLTMASFVPDFVSGLGIAGLFGLASTFDTTPDEINNLCVFPNVPFCSVELQS